MIYTGIDDTDTIDSRGTNQLALQIVEELQQQWRCHQILRHQLFQDDRVPFTSKNGSASLLFSPLRNASAEELFESLSTIMQKEFIPGSDPGLAVAEAVPDEIQQFGQICKIHVTSQADAGKLADRYPIHLEGLGGTNDGIIGALAAIGLAATENDGRIIYLESWDQQLEGTQPVSRIRDYGVTVICRESGREVESGSVTLARKLRPNRSEGRNLLFVERTPNGYQALKLP
jgi:tRNA(Ile2) C34 agmatinyltransferase TiaS